MLEAANMAVGYFTKTNRMAGRKFCIARAGRQVEKRACRKTWMGFCVIEWQIRSDSKLAKSFTRNSRCYKSCSIAGEKLHRFDLSLSMSRDLIPIFPPKYRFPYK